MMRDDRIAACSITEKTRRFIPLKAFLLVEKYNDYSYINFSSARFMSSPDAYQLADFTLLPPIVPAFPF